MTDWEAPTLRLMTVLPLRRRRMISLGQRLLMAQLLVHLGVGLYFTVSARMQTQDIINERQSYAIQSNEHRIARVERDVAALEVLPVRVSVLEETMDEQKWLVRGMALAVIGQLAIQIFGGRGKPE